MNRSHRPGALLLSMLTCAAYLQAQNGQSWKFIEDEHLKVGVNLGAGAAIGWVSAAARPEENVVNVFDEGRYLQQSYYGDEDGSMWGNRPWRYNPVQGGDWKGNASRVDGFRVESPTKLYARVTPRHWANGKLLEEAVMEEWLTLEGGLAHVKTRFTWKGTGAQRAHHQEVPACFVDPKFGTLVYCEGEAWTGTALTRKEPGEKNEYIKLGEPWVAWEARDGSAVGLCAPQAKAATCYRVPGKAACSYVAPIETLALTPGIVMEREWWIGIGRVEELRKKFAEKLGR